LTGTLHILFCGNYANLFGGNKHTFCEGNERVAFLIVSIEFSLVEIGEAKEGHFSAKMLLKKRTVFFDR